jgi:hypothetical protein
MNFVGKIVVYQFVQMERGVTVESGFTFVSLFWVSAMAGVLVYGVVVFIWFLGLLWGGLVLTCVGRSADVVEGCGRGRYGCFSMDSCYGFCLLIVLEIILMH